jgi:pimeloyl-ACP methyl ester carboxylesterase
LRGAHSDTIDAKFWQQWKSNPNHQLIDFEHNGHLLPLENPGGVIQRIMPFIEQHQS